MKYKRKSSSSFMSALSSSGLYLSRRIDKLKEIQKTEPEFNYKNNYHLKFEIDSQIKKLEELKTTGVKI